MGDKTETFGFDFVILCFEGKPFGNGLRLLEPFFQEPFSLNYLINKVCAIKGTILVKGEFFLLRLTTITNIKIL